MRTVNTLGVAVLAGCSLTTFTLESAQAQSAATLVEVVSFWGESEEDGAVWKTCIDLEIGGETIEGQYRFWNGDVEAKGSLVSAAFSADGRLLEGTWVGGSDTGYFRFLFIADELARFSGIWGFATAAVDGGIWWGERSTERCLEE